MESPEAAVGADVFKLAMRQLVGAVSIVTIGTGERRTGFTATSVTGFSIEPPTVLVSLNRQSSSWPALLGAGAFAVNVLGVEHTESARRFAGASGITGRQRYEGAQWLDGQTGSLLLDGAVVSLDCELDEAIERYSHAILIGKVRSTTIRTDARPLAYFDGHYRQLAMAPMT